MFTNTMYLIENHTNMHVGSGEANFGTVDRLIQRDAITGYPIIHASSLKGALREFCEFRHNADDAPTFIEHTFGNENNAGKVRFYDAWLLSVPFRSDREPYFMCTSPKAVAQLLEMARVMGIEIEGKEAFEQVVNYRYAYIGIRRDNARIEDFDANTVGNIDFNALEKLLGGPVAIVPDKLFDSLLKDLPVIARNQLENGESKNLWYEEVLPRKSRLFTFVSTPTNLNDDDAASLANHFQRLHGYLGDETPIQLGANASVGYGLCRFTEVGRA